MKLQLLPKSIPRIPLVLACSGGVDSMAILSFLLKGNQDVTAAFYHHGISEDDAHEKVVTEFCTDFNVRLVKARLDIPVVGSIEQHWREHRYKFLRSLGKIVITGHHLDDCLESYMMGALHGQPKLIPYHTNGVIRPFLLNRKIAFREWNKTYNVPFVEDPLNYDFSQPRANIRHNLIPVIENIHPGFSTMVSKKVMDQYQSYRQGLSNAS